MGRPLMFEAHAAPVSPLRAASPLEAAARGVVLVRAGGQWASGVVASASGLILTNAHLLPTLMSTLPHFTPPSPSAAQCSVRFRSTPDGHYVWIPARVVHTFRNHLDLMVLQLLLDSSSTGSYPEASASPGIALSPLNLSGRALVSGREVVVVGHGLFGPSAAWPPSLTRGNITKVWGGPRHCV